MSPVLSNLLAFIHSHSDVYATLNDDGTTLTAYSYASCANGSCELVSDQIPANLRDVKQWLGY